MKKRWSIFFWLSFFIVSSFSASARSFPYHLHLTSDLLILSGGSGVWLLAADKANRVPALSLSDMAGLNAMDLNAFDRSAVYHYSEGNLDSYFKYGMFAAPAVMLVPLCKSGEWFLTYSVMYLEVAVCNAALTELSKALVQRTRPFYYNPALSDEAKLALGADRGKRDSFVSGHTSIAFSSAVFLSKTLEDIYGRSNLTKVVWGASLSVAATTGYLRYRSGSHFPTDILAGAVLGAAIGYTIPAIHKEKKRYSMVVMPNSFYMSYTF